MDPQEEAKITKTKMVIDMAITFSAMNRVFEKGSKKKITQKLEKSLSLLTTIESKDDFERIHSEFCNWFIKNVRKSKKRMGDRNGEGASYGQAAKLFNVATKVFVYYCNLPCSESSSKLMPLLHAAIDTRMMKYLQKRYPKEKFKSGTIEAVGESDYRVIRKLVTMHIRDEFTNLIMPVHYDDIMWFRINRPV